MIKFNCIDLFFFFYGLRKGAIKSKQNSDVKDDSFKALSLLPPVVNPLERVILVICFRWLFLCSGHPRVSTNSGKIETYEKLSKHFPSLPDPRWQIALVFTGIFFISIFTDQLH